MYRRATGLEGFKSEGLSVRGFYFILLFLELYYVFLISNSATPCISKGGGAIKIYETPKLGEVA